MIALQLMHSLLVQVNVKDAGFNALMAKAAAKLNLCAHFVGPSGSETLVHAAADLEGHRGTDGRYVFVVCVCVCVWLCVCGCLAVCIRVWCMVTHTFLCTCSYYVCDTARLFPPLPPSKLLRGSHLTRLMRQEAVSASDTPLSSDAFTMFGRHRAQHHNAAVSESWSASRCRRTVSHCIVVCHLM